MSALPRGDADPAATGTDFEGPATSTPQPAEDTSTVATPPAYRTEAPPDAPGVSSQRNGALWVALVATLLAGLGQWALRSWAGAPPGYVLALPAVLVAAWYGGFWWGALVAVVLAPLLPVLAGVAWDEPARAAAGLGLVAGLLGAGLLELLHRSQRRSQGRAEVLAQAHGHLAAALEATGVTLLEWDTGLRCTWLHNPPAGVVAASWLGQPAEALCAPADGERLRTTLAQVLASGEPVRADFALAAGTCFEHDIAPLRDGSGRICGLRSAAIDVSALRARQAREAESQALFRAAQERSPDAFELLRAERDANGRIVDFVWEYANPAAAALCAHAGAALPGQAVLGAAGERFQRARFAHWCQALAAGEPQRAEFGRDEAARGPASYLGLALPLGECVAAITSDATARARSLEAERRHSATLRRAATLQNDFLGHLSHELRTPLNAITGWAHLLTRAGTDASLLQRAAEAIGRNARAQAVLVDALLDMNGVVTGSLRLERQACDLSAALQRALATATPLAQAKWIRLHAADIAPGVPCFGDAARLEQVFGNLLSNAVKFTPLGGDVWVTLERAEGALALIEVRDSGEGVPAAALPHFFDRFHRQGSGTRPHAGLGLGLTLVKSLVELHGGRVSVHSDGPGLGTTVRAHLPIVESPGERTEPAAGRTAPAGTGPAPAGDAAEDAAPLTFRRILVLEDEADSLEVLSVLLRQQGAVVRAFDNAEQALAAAEHGSFDLVISDLGMPGMNGLEFMRRLQRRPLPLKAIALTAYAGEAERAEALEAGYTRVETKPISPPQFLAVVLAEVGAGGTKEGG